MAPLLSEKEGNGAFFAPKTEDFMPRFFVDRSQIRDGIVTITGDDAFHISRSLRMAAGERITVSDKTEFEYDCELVGFSEVVTAKIISTRELSTEPNFRATVYQALVKGDKIDTVIQKSVECGASAIRLFESERCIVRKKDDEKKSERRSKIALEAAKQCGRGIVPDVLPTVSFDDALGLASGADIKIFCYEGDGTLPLRRYLSEQAKAFSGKIPSVSIIIGSEGGFSEGEVERAKRLGFIPVGLGKRILRTETAAGFVLAALVYEFELG